jgi:hypothetical protein
LIEIISQIESLYEIAVLLLFDDEIGEFETMQLSVEVQITVSEIFVGTNDIGRERVVLQVVDLESLVVDFDSESEVSLCAGVVGVYKQVALVLQTLHNWFATAVGGIPAAELVFLIMEAQFLVLFFQHFVDILFNG